MINTYMKKLELKDICLTIEQVSELQKLGVDFSNNMLYLFRQTEFRGNRKCVSDWKITTQKICQSVGLTTTEFVPTLTDAEMFEMLPKTYNGYRVEMVAVEDYFFIQYIDKYNHVAHFKDMFMLTGYLSDREDLSVRVGGETLCEALFKMIKFLKTNKLM